MLRQTISGRPLLVLAAALVVGLTLPGRPFHLVFLLPLLFLRPAWVPTLLGLLVGIVLAPSITEGVTERQLVKGDAWVASVPRSSEGRTTCEISVDGRLLSMTVPGHPDLVLGDALKVTGIAKPLKEETDRYLRTQGIEGRLSPVELTRVGRGPALFRFADSWRRSFTRFCERWMPAEAAALTEALSLNLDSSLDAQVRDRLKETGTVHIVSASGMHVFILAFAVAAALSILPVPRVVQLAVLGAILVLYAAATGLNPPVVRSGLMAMVGACAYFSRRERDVLSALALAAILYLLWRPNGVYDIGFQISFVTVGALALFAGPTEHDGESWLAGMWTKLKGAASVSWIASIASLPLIAYYYGTASLVSLPANLLVAPVVPVIVVGGLGAHLVSFLVPALGIGVISFVAPFCGWLLFVVENLGGRSWSVVDVPAFSAYWIPITYGALLLTWREKIVQP